MKSILRAYVTEDGPTCLNVFDLVSGRGDEVAQIRALALLIAEQPDLALSLFQLPAIRDFQKKVSGGFPTTVGTLVIDLEMVGSIDGQQVRADLVLRFSGDDKPLLALVIEGKSAKLSGPTDEELFIQLRKYVSAQAFPLLAGYPIIPVALTRTRRILPGVASVTWMDVDCMVRAFAKSHDKDGLCGKFLEYLERTSGDMKQYEVEILSLPAGDTIDAIEETFVHACPDNKNYSYRLPLRMAFRRAKVDEWLGGEMERLYKVADVFSFDPLVLAEREAALESIEDEDLQRRVKKYMEMREAGRGWQDYGTFRFYILDPADMIELPHRPRPKRNTPGPIYFDLCEVLDQSKRVVRKAV